MESESDTEQMGCSSKCMSPLVTEARQHEGWHALLTEARQHEGWHALRDPMSNLRTTPVIVECWCRISAQIPKKTASDAQANDQRLVEWLFHSFDTPSTRNFEEIQSVHASGETLCVKGLPFWEEDLSM